MSIRETLNEHRGLVFTIAGACVTITLFIIFLQLRPVHPHLAGVPEKSFYTDDDGATYFIDDFLKATPFDHNGKPACQALVYRCKESKPAVGYIAKLSTAQRAQLEAIAPDNRVEFTRTFMSFQGAMDVKKPGSKRWLSVGEKGYIDETIVTCADGSVEGLNTVSPNDPDNGAGPE